MERRPAGEEWCPRTYLHTRRGVGEDCNIPDLVHVRSTPVEETATEAEKDETKTEQGRLPCRMLLALLLFDRSTHTVHHDEHRAHHEWKSHAPIDDSAVIHRLRLIN
jgi:hypothetical protein